MHCARFSGKGFGVCKRASESRRSVWLINSASSPGCPTIVPCTARGGFSLLEDLIDTVFTACREKDIPIISSAV